MIGKNQIIRNTFVLVATITVCINGSCREELDELKKTLQKDFIHLPTAKVIAKRNKKRPVTEEFQQFLDKDQMMQGALRINKEGDSGAKLTVIQFSRNVSEDISDKGKELENEFKSAVQLKLISQFATVVGGLLIVGGVAGGNSIVAGAGLCVGVAGGTVWYISSDMINTIPEHLKSVHVMGEKWDHAFAVKEEK